MEGILRSVATLGALAILLGGCTPTPGQQEDLTASVPSPSPTVCDRGEPLKLEPRPGQIGRSVVPSRCPASKPKGVGYSKKTYLGSVLAQQPCKELPDFAGSWWKPQRPFPEHFGKLGHELVRGTMTLVAEGEAEFEGPAVRMRMGDHTMRVPPKGRLAVSFIRIEGPAHVGGCD